MDASAVITGAYRYRLDREWSSAPGRAVWIMLNPSTADAGADDPTLRRCLAFTRAWGLGGLTVVNLFALRSTDPRELACHPDPVGPACDHYIAGALAGASAVVAAWGAHPMASRRAEQVIAMTTGRLACLGTTKDGQPRHPLYIRTGTLLVPYTPTGTGGRS